MSNRYMRQFLYGYERQPVMIDGSFTQSGSAGAFATLVDNGMTYTAVTMGSAGNSITVALVAGGTAGAEVVTVTGNAISVSIESTVSTRTQVKTALDGSAAASALIGTTVASGGTAATLMAATPLASGVDTVFVSDAKGMSISQIGTGLYKISLQSSYAALLSSCIMLQRTAAVDLDAQLKSSDPTSASQSIIFRIKAGSTNTNMASADKLYCNFVLRNSA